jgi:hypothetical protein
MRISLASGARALAALVLAGLFAPGVALAGPTPCTIVNNVATCTLDQSQGVAFSTAPSGNTNTPPTGVSHVIVNNLSKPIVPAAGTSGVKLTFDMSAVTPTSGGTNGFAAPALQVDVAAGQPINVTDQALPLPFPLTSAIVVTGRGGNGTNGSANTDENGGNGAAGPAIVINNATALSEASTVVPVSRAVAFGLGGQLAQAQAGEAKIESALTCLALADFNTCSGTQKNDVAYFSCVFGKGTVVLLGSGICLGGNPVPAGPALVADIKAS